VIVYFHHSAEQNVWSMQMKLNKIVILCSLVSLIGVSAMNTYPASAKDRAADEAKQQAKAAADTAKANKEVSKGHPARAGRAAKKAEKAANKAAKDQAKLNGR
jgi:hypothetical protein